MGPRVKLIDVSSQIDPSLYSAKEWLIIPETMAFVKTFVMGEGPQEVTGYV